MVLEVHKLTCGDGNPLFGQLCTGIKNFRLCSNTEFFC